MSIKIKVENASPETVFCGVHDIEPEVSQISSTAKLLIRDFVFQNCLKSNAITQNNQEAILNTFECWISKSLPLLFVDESLGESQAPSLSLLKNFLSSMSTFLISVNQKKEDNHTIDDTHTVLSKLSETLIHLYESKQCRRFPEEVKEELQNLTTSFLAQGIETFLTEDSLQRLAFGFCEDDRPLEESPPKVNPTIASEFNIPTELLEEMSYLIEQVIELGNPQYSSKIAFAILKMHLASNQVDQMSILKKMVRLLTSCFVTDLSKSLVRGIVLSGSEIHNPYSKLIQLAKISDTFQKYVWKGDNQGNFILRTKVSPIPEDLPEKITEKAKMLLDKKMTVVLGAKMTAVIQCMVPSLEQFKQTLLSNFFMLIQSPRHMKEYLVHYFLKGVLIPHLEEQFVFVKSSLVHPEFSMFSKDISESQSDVAQLSSATSSLVNKALTTYGEQIVLTESPFPKAIFDLFIELNGLFTVPFVFSQNQKLSPPGIEVQQVIVDAFGSFGPFLIDYSDSVLELKALGTELSDTNILKKMGAKFVAPFDFQGLDFEKRLKEFFHLWLRANKIEVSPSINKTINIISPVIKDILDLIISPQVILTLVDRLVEIADVSTVPDPSDKENAWDPKVLNSWTSYLALITEGILGLTRTQKNSSPIAQILEGVKDIFSRSDLINGPTEIPNIKNKLKTINRINKILFNSDGSINEKIQSMFSMTDDQLKETAKVIKNKLIDFFVFKMNLDQPILIFIDSLPENFNGVEILNSIKENPLYQQFVKLGKVTNIASAFSSFIGSSDVSGVIDSANRLIKMVRMLERLHLDKLSESISNLKKCRRDNSNFFEFVPQIIKLNHAIGQITDHISSFVRELGTFNSRADQQSQNLMSGVTPLFEKVESINRHLSELLSGGLLASMTLVENVERCVTSKKTMRTFLYQYLIHPTMVANLKLSCDGFSNDLSDFNENYRLGVDVLERSLSTIDETHFSRYMQDCRRLAQVAQAKNNFVFLIKTLAAWRKNELIESASKDNPNLQQIIVNLVDGLFGLNILGEQEHRKLKLEATRDFSLVFDYLDLKFISFDQSVSPVVESAKEKLKGFCSDEVSLGNYISEIQILQIINGLQKFLESYVSGDIERTRMVQVRFMEIIQDDWAEVSLLSKYIKLISVLEQFSFISDLDELYLAELKMCDENSIKEHLNLYYEIKVWEEITEKIRLLSKGLPFSIEVESEICAFYQDFGSYISNQVKSLSSDVLKMKISQIFMKKYRDTFQVKMDQFPSVNENYRVTTVSTADDLNGVKAKLLLLEQARESIVMSGCYFGGAIFDKALDIISKRLHETNILDVKLIGSNQMLSKDNVLRIRLLEKEYPDRFLMCITNEIQPLYRSPVSGRIVPRTNHTKLLVIDYGKYFVIGGSGVEDRWNKSISQLRKKEVDSRPAQPVGFYDLDLIVEDQNKYGEGFQLYQNLLELFPSWIAKNAEERIRLSFARKFNPSYRFIERTSFPLISSIQDRLEKGRVSNIKAYVSGPDQLVGTNQFCKDLMEDVRNAKQSIDIQHMYFDPTGALLEELIRAAERNVQLNLFVNQNGEKSPVTHDLFVEMSRDKWKKLFGGVQRENVQIHEYNHPYATYHKKIVIIDGKIAYMGSSNLGMKSLTMMDHEMDVRVESDIFMQSIKEVEKEMFSQVPSELAYRYPTNLRDVSLQELFAKPFL